MKVKLDIPASTRGILTIPVRGYFYTDYMTEGRVLALNETYTNRYIGHGQVPIGGNFWYNVPATYHTFDNGYGYAIQIGNERINY